MELFGICGRKGVVRKTHLTGLAAQAEELAVQAAGELAGGEKD